MKRAELVFLETYIHGIADNLKEYAECFEKQREMVYLENIICLAKSALAVYQFSVDENFDDCIRRVVDGVKKEGEAE